MYDELIKRLRDAAKMSEALTVLLPHSEGNATAKLYNDAADAIEALSPFRKQVEKGMGLLDKADELLKAVKPRWIPVKERLPEIHTMVLVMDKAHDMAVGSLEKLWDGEVWVCPFADVEDEQCPVTHWMPLPEPPKEE